jgi:antitoxin CptB
MDTEYARLKWRCRRGMLELDLLLQPFVVEVYPTMTDDEKLQFHTLLDMQDQELLECLMLQQTPEDRALDHVIRKIRSTV